MRVFFSWFCVVFEGGCRIMWGKKDEAWFLQGTRTARGDAIASIGWRSEIGCRRQSILTSAFYNKLGISSNNDP